jgi:NAD(P) transhydrogenase subunit alpha
MDFISILSIFVLACFVGYYVVWSVTPALHTPLMAVTNAISSVIIVGALIASAAGALSSAPAKVAATTAAPVAVDRDLTPTGIAVAEKTVVAPSPPPHASAGHSLSKWLGLIAVVLASVNIFGGFAVTERMLAMYKKKERPAAAK